MGDLLVDNRTISAPARGLALIAAAVLALLGVSVTQSAFAPAAHADAGEVVVFDSLPATSPGSLSSYGMQAYQMKEFGQRLQLGGTARELSTIEIGFVDWACGNWASGANPCVTEPGTTFAVPITVNVYAAGPSSETVGSLIATTSRNVDVPFRPSASIECTDNRWWNGTSCFNGYYFTADFAFDAGLVLPDDIVVSVTYNTNTQGPSPVGASGPVDSFNVAVSGTLGAVGAIADPTTSVFVNSSTAAHYTPDGVDGTGIDASWLNTFHAGRSWSQAPIPIRINAVAPVPALHVDPYFVSGALYKGIGVDLKATDVTGATEVRVTIHRSSGGDVVKTSKATGGVLAAVNAGNAVTAPIVIQPGTYNEATSPSWQKPDAIWSPETVPTGVTVELLRGDEVLVSTTRSSFGSAGGATLADVMPVVPTLHVDPYFTAGALYKGIGVDLKATGVTDATEVRVTVHRSMGGDVVKTSKATGGVLAAVNAGNVVTAPIVIQPGTYNEAG
ncbi:MAG TPA: hypothetical protein VNQ52_12165, partial [Microbacteriaceae bacterium]|nr:hypothetical protein [Microbacteriaceae bacterium]